VVPVADDAAMRVETIGAATLYLGDCLEILPTLGKVDAVVTDPPYFKVKGEKWDNQWDKADKFLDWLATVLDGCSEAMEDWASIYCFCSPQMQWQVEGLVRQRFVFLNSIRWRKAEGWHNKQNSDDLRIFQQNWEGCLFGQKADDQAALQASGYDKACADLHRKVYEPIGAYFKEERERAGFSYREIANYIDRDPALYLRWEEGSSLPSKEDYTSCQTLFNGYLRKEYEDLRKEYEDLRKEYEDLRKEYEDLRRPFNVYDPRQRGDIWDYPCVMGYQGKHPCEKPIQMMEQIVGTSSKSGQSILDPFMGSGTTGVACMNLGRKFIGIEIDEKYFEIACERIRHAQAQGRLFA
jgi:adenine-specific DNA-methyltransferase